MSGLKLSEIARDNLLKAFEEEAEMQRTHRIFKCEGCGKIKGFFEKDKIIRCRKCKMAVPYVKVKRFVEVYD